MTNPASHFVIVGKISSAYGIKGWVNIQSFTEPVTNILNYQPWYISTRKGNEAWEPIDVVTGRAQGKHVVAQLKGCQDRNTAELYRGLEIAVPRSQLPAVDENEHYWIDLLGLDVITLSGVKLGVVDSFLETGANDVMVVTGAAEKQYLIPYVKNHFVKKIDLEKRCITVDWDPEF